MGTSERRSEETVDKGWVLLLGDAMEDVYWEGWAKDISAEAPIVRTIIHTKHRYPGGAANVWAILGDAEVWVARYFGEGRPLKYRIMSDGHQVARFDLDDECQPILLPPNMNLDGCKVVIVSDYHKGSIDQKVLGFLASIPSEIPIFVDTKRNPNLYPDRSIFFPNDKEFNQFDYFSRPIDQIMHKHGHSGLHYNGKWYMHLASEVKSVVGAGDVVLAAFVYAMLGGRSYAACADFACYAGTRKVECPRTEAPPLKEMFEQWQNTTNVNE
jgi:bifunctional ADP-heptose synthase (sugar kinase/adenylyltransferase)